MNTHELIAKLAKFHGEWNPEVKPNPKLMHKVRRKISIIESIQRRVRSIFNRSYVEKEPVPIPETQSVREWITQSVNADPLTIAYRKSMRNNCEDKELPE